MQTKLTLRIEENVIKKAKQWAHSHHVSLSRIIENYLAQLSQKTNDRESISIDDWTRRFIGIIPAKKMTDKNIKKKRIRYLEDKHA